MNSLSLCLSSPPGRHCAVQGRSGTGDTHMSPVPRESLLHLLHCSVQINQLFARVCSTNPTSTPTRPHRAVQGQYFVQGRVAHICNPSLVNACSIYCCSVCRSTVCSMKQVRDQNKSLTLVGFPGRVIVFGFCFCVLSP